MTHSSSISEPQSLLVLQFIFSFLFHLFSYPPTFSIPFPTFFTPNSSLLYSHYIFIPSYSFTSISNYYYHPTILPYTYILFLILSYSLLSSSHFSSPIPFLPIILFLHLFSSYSTYPLISLFIFIHFLYSSFLHLSFIFIYSSFIFFFPSTIFIYL